MSTIPQYKIEYTKEYSKFKTMPVNRDKDLGHTNDLELSFMELPELIMAMPIIVGPKFEVVDGQHRLPIYKRMSIPVPYIQIDKASADQIRAINILQKRWQPKDFAKSYAAKGDKTYQRYTDAIHEYKLGHTVTLIAICGNRHTLNKYFRIGKLAELILDNADDRLAMFDKIRSALPIPISVTLAHCLAIIMVNEHFDINEFMRKLSQYPAHEIKRLYGQRANLAMLEDIYNFHRQTRVRLF